MPRSHKPRKSSDTRLYQTVDIIETQQTKVGKVKVRTNKTRRIMTGYRTPQYSSMKTALEKEAFKAWKAEPKPRPARGPWINNYITTHTPTPHVDQKIDH